MSIVTTEPPPVENRAIQLAELVAHPDAPRPFAIGPDNARTDWLPTLAEAAESGYAYAVTVAPDVLVIDADDARYLRRLACLRAEIAGDGWPSLIVASGREGHRHLWAVIPPADARTRWAARAEALGLPAPRTVMRPPGAPHRLGLAVELLGCPDTFAADVVAVRAASRPSGYRLDWCGLLRSGRYPHGWQGEGTGSATTWHVAIGARRAGWTLDRLRAELADPANMGGRSYRTRLGRTGKEHADYWLEHYVWPSACDAAEHPITPPADDAEAVAQLDALTAAVEAAHWPGRGGATDRAVLLALIDAGRRHATLCPTLSTRTLAERARVHRNTVSASSARLRAAGWLLVAELGRGTTKRADDGTVTEQANATRWRLTVPNEARELVTRVVTPPGAIPLDGTSTRVLADVGRWRGIGLNGARVLSVLVGGARTARELGELLGLNVGNLRYRLLPRLAELGLVATGGSQWWAVADLDAAVAAAAEDLGLTGKTDAVHAQHEAERARYLDWRELTRPRRETRSDARRRAERDRAAAAGAVPLPLDLDAVGPLEHRLTDPDPPPGHRAHLAHVGIGSAGHEH